MSRLDDRRDGSQFPHHPQEHSQHLDGDLPRSADDVFLTRADVEIVACICRRGPDSREYAVLSEILFEYGFGALVNLGKNQMLLPMVAKECKGLSLPQPPSWSQDWYRIVYESTRAAVPRFMREQVLGGKWDPAKASLRAYFVGACFWAFKKEYEKYYKEEGSGRESPAADEVIAAAHDQQFGPGPPSDPQDIVDKRERVRWALALVDNDTKVALWRSEVEGHTRGQIAEDFGITDDALNSKIARLRRRNKHDGNAR